eukprot:758316-Amphidinium_carterae.1
MTLCSPAGKKSFTGILPESGLREVTGFDIYWNIFKGALPDGGLRAMLAVTYFDVSGNSFTGMPDGGLRAMLALTYFDISENNFTGTLPESCILRKVADFRIYTNRFAGALPDGGLRAMLAVTFFSIHTNSFTGILPTMPGGSRDTTVGTNR